MSAKKIVALLVFLGVASCTAVAVPNLLTAMQRSHQKRTLADMRTIATAWEELCTNRKSYLVGRPGAVTYDDLQKALVPKYLRQMPATDGWSNPFLFATDGRSYSIRSPGRDHRIDPHAAAGATTDFDCDVIYASGTFISYPEGLCQ